jgi:hypothetical protein
VLAAARALKEKDLRLLAEYVPEKEYGPPEIISAVSQLIRGMARFSDKIGILDYRGAHDIASRIAWPRIKQVMLCAVYSVSRTMAEEELCLDIQQQLIDQPQPPRPSSK